MTFVTRGIILPRGTDIVMCHNRDLTHGIKLFFAKRIKKLEKIKKPRE